MTNITKLEFLALDIICKYNLSQILDAKIHLDTMGVENTIKENNNAPNQERTKALIFINHYLSE